MKKIFLFCIVLSFSINAYSQWGPKPVFTYAGSVNSEQQWLEFCNTLKRTVSGMTGQMPPMVDKTTVQMLLDYVHASAGSSNMKIEVFDVWSIEFPDYAVVVWFTNYEQGIWSYKSINFLLY